MASPPTLPPELKPVAQYLQRAQELKEKDPVMAYWCTYYAAKQGIGLKVRSKEGRAYLIDMMDSLEKMKLQLNDSDALGDEAGQAYIENFALRVFDMADKEDRSGKTNKGTARKFLAASCFLDLMNIFENVDPDIAQKVTYAKWRAAEISKALREGREPAPPARDSPTGLEDDMSAGNSEGSVETLVGPPPTTFAKIPVVHSPRPSPGAAPNVPLPDSPPNASIAGSDNDLLRTPTKSGSRVFPTDERSITPGMWSTVATPGIDDRFPIVPHDAQNDSPSGPPRRPTLGAHHDEPDEDAWSTASNNPMSRQNSWTPSAFPEDSEASPSTTVAPQLPPPPAAFVVPTNGNTLASPAAKRVHFSPSVVGGSDASTSPSASTIDLPIVANHPPSPPVSAADVLRTYPGPPPLPPNHSTPTPSAPPPPAVRTQPLPSAPPVPYPGTSRASAPPPPEAPIPSLTPKAIATVQKHCKFAISALDYEDAETARKELRTALAMLGG